MMHIDQTGANRAITIDRSEWRFVTFLIFAILIMTTLPYSFGALTSPPDRQFMGFMLDVPDHGQYLSWYKGFQSSLLVSNKLTSEPNDSIFFNLLWFALGRTGALTGWSYDLIYQLFRLAASAFFLVVLYVFCALMMERLSWRRTAFVIISLGSGLGWIWVALKYSLSYGKLLFPLDVYVAEGNSFLCMLGYPHFIAAAGLILAVFILLLFGARREQMRYAVAAGIVALILGWQHAYDILILYGVPGVYTLLLSIRQRRLPRYWIQALFILGLISVWPALYSVWLTTADPLWEEVLEQFSNAGVFTPDPFHLLILMGLPLVAAIVALVLMALRQDKRPTDDPVRTDGERFVVVWFVVGLLLNYVPTDFQIHMLNSWQVPVGLLATWGLYRYLTPALGKFPLREISRLGRPTHFLPALFVLLVLPTNLYLLSWRFVDLKRHGYPYYLSRDEVAALHWLDANTDPEAAVLSSLTIGQYIPGIAGNTAFLAHWAQTVDFYAKETLVSAFFADHTADDVRQQILSRHKIAYIFYGPAEWALGAFDPSSAGYLEPVLSLPSVTVLRVRAESIASP